MVHTYSHLAELTFRSHKHRSNHDNIAEASSTSSATASSAETVVKDNGNVTKDHSTGKYFSTVSMHDSSGNEIVPSLQNCPSGIKSVAIAIDDAHRIFLVSLSQQVARLLDIVVLGCARAVCRAFWSRLVRI